MKRPKVMLALAGLSMMFLLASPQFASGLTINQLDFNSSQHAAIVDASLENWSSTSDLTHWTEESGSISKSTIRMGYDDGSMDPNNDFSARLYGSTQIKISQVLNSHTEGVAAGKTISFSGFVDSTSSSSDDHVRAEIYYEYFRSYNLYSRTVTGDWVLHASGNDWKRFDVTASIPSDVTKIVLRVIADDLNGAKYVSLYVDKLSLNLVESERKVFSYGDASLVTTLSHSFDKNNGYRQISFSTALGYDITPVNNGYFVEQVKFRVEMMPLSSTWYGSKYSDQDGTLSLYQSAQGNDKNQYPNPRATQDNADSLLMGAEIATGLILAGVATVVSGGVAGAMLLALDTAGSEVFWSVVSDNTNTYKNFADGSTGDWYTQAVYSHSYTGASSPQIGPREGFVSNSYDWTFKENQGSYYLKIIAELTIGGHRYVDPFFGSNYWESSVVSTITFVDYIYV